jgi:hypothetical protein
MHRRHWQQQRLSTLLLALRGCSTYMCGRLRIPRADDLLIKTTDIHQRGEKISAPHATWPFTHTPLYSLFSSYYSAVLAHTHSKR